MGKDAQEFIIFSMIKFSVNVVLLDIGNLEAKMTILHTRGGTCILCYISLSIDYLYIQIVSIVFCIFCQLIFTECVPSETWYVNR